MERNNKISALEYTAQKKVLQFSRAISKHLLFRSLGIKGEVFETGRTKERQRELLRTKKTWTMDSYHLNGLAFDVVLSIKKQGVVQKYIWENFYKGKKIYDVLSKLGLKVGLRSLGYTHKQDYFHFEMPQVFQRNAPHCYGYAIVNCIQKHSKKWRSETKTVCSLRASNIVDYIEEYRLLKGVPGALEAAKYLGYIKSYSHFDPRDVTDWESLNGRKLIISQKRKIMGSSSSRRWKKHKENISRGFGIFNHCAVFSFYESGKLWLINSHQEYPCYDIETSIANDVIEELYEIEI